MTFSTRIHGHWIDLITRSTLNYIHTLTATYGLFNRFTIIVEIQFKHNSVDSKCNILYRYAHNIDVLPFNDDIEKSEFITNFKADLSQLCEQYDTRLHTLLDKDAPVRPKPINTKPPAPWMSPDIINAEMRYKKECHFCNRLINKAKSHFYRNMISNNSDNLRQLCNCINRTLHRTASVFLPSHY